MDFILLLKLNELYCLVMEAIRPCIDYGVGRMIFSFWAQRSGSFD